MATEISGRNYEITPDIRALLDKKLSKIQEKLFKDVIDVRVVLQVEKYRNTCEILITGKDHDVKTVQESDDSMQDAINSALDHIKRQAQKNRNKIRDHHKGERQKTPVTEWSVQVLQPLTAREEAAETANTPKIIETNALPIRPMSVEEAALRLDESKDQFIVFRDIDTEKISVIYKRRDANLGLIAPEI